MRDAILKRVSTRTFIKQDLTSSEISKINKVLIKYSNVKGPFGNTFTLTFNLNESTENSSKIGTYGLLKNVPAFIGGTCANTKETIIDFGYVFEKVILDLTEMGFATCWLGGTFKRKHYRKKLKENQIIPALSPVGYPKDKRSFIDRAIRSSAQSQKRLPFGELFHYYDTNKELEEVDDSRIVDVFNLVRQGPSASNKQPWRIYVTKDHSIAHVYLKRTNGYAKAFKYDLQMLDIGIALSHLEIGLNHHGFKYEKEVIEENTYFDGLEYIITYKRAN